MTEVELDQTLRTQEMLAYMTAAGAAAVVYVLWDVGRFVFLKITRFVRTTYARTGRWVQQVTQVRRSWDRERCDLAYIR